MLSINFKKTNYMIITSPKKKTNIRITACNIEQKSQIKYLGVFIDEHLKWDAQLQHINNKITKNIGILFKLRHYVPISTLKQLYYTLIYPYLTYGLMSWGTAYQTKLNKIKVSQNNCIRCIFFANKRESPTPYNYHLSQASFRRHSLHNTINTVPQVKSKTISFSSLTYISTVLNGLHQGEWPLQASHTITTW